MVSPRSLSRRIWIAGLACLALAGWPRATGAQETGNGFAPQQMARKEWSLEKAGQVQQPADVDRLSAPIAEPEPFEDRAAETRVAGPVPAPVPAAGSVPAEVLALDTTMPARISEVLACRLEIATDRRVRVERVAAGTVLLRWTLQPGGGVTEAEAVAQSRTDPDILFCARRKMESWVFIHGPGDAPLRVEQTVKFD